MALHRLSGLGLFPNIQLSDATLAARKAEQDRKDKLNSITNSITAAGDVFNKTYSTVASYDSLGSQKEIALAQARAEEAKLAQAKIMADTSKDTGFFGSVSPIVLVVGGLTFATLIVGGIMLANSGSEKPKPQGTRGLEGVRRSSRAARGSNEVRTTKSNYGKRGTIGF
jgi:hypothetical protein